MTNQSNKGMALYAMFLRNWRNGMGRELAPLSVSTGVALAALEAAEAGTARLSTVDWLKVVHFYKAKIPEGLCRGCGCCEDSRCAGGCVWVEGNLCSSCNAISKMFQSRITGLLDLLAKPSRCKDCHRTIYFLTTKHGNPVPISESGLRHFIDCPYSRERRREQIKRKCQGEE